MYRSKRIPCVLLALGIPLASQAALAGYSFEYENLKGEINLTAGAASVTTRGANFGAGAVDVRSLENKGSKVGWQEAYLKPGITLDYSLSDTLSLLAGASAVAAGTYGDGDAGGFTRSADNRINTEEAYVGIRAGDWKFTAGRQNYIIGSGFIVMDGNLDLFGDGAYWLGPRTAFKDSAVLDWSHGPVKTQAFTLRTDDHYGDYRMTGANLDYDLAGQVTLGAMAMKVDTLASKSSNATRRDGMQVYNLRALGGQLPGLPNLTSMASMRCSAVATRGVNSMPRPGTRKPITSSRICRSPRRSATATPCSPVTTTWLTTRRRPGTRSTRGSWTGAAGWSAT